MSRARAGGPQSSMLWVAPGTPWAPVALVALLVGQGWGHGRLIEPPSRSTMWRYGFDTPPNYNDHESYCGGFTRQWQTNRGRCGICGDAWDEPQPRANEAGGRYGRGIITRKYTKGQVIKVRIELTANHMGHFEFRLCPNNNPAKAATQACLDRYLLEQAGGSGPSYYPGPGNRVFETQYLLPKDLTCAQCVFQWRYIAANNWGTCRNGTGKVGCGPQEEFRACSDVVITEADGTADRTVNMDVDIWDEEEQELPVNWDDEEDGDVEERGVERVVIIVLASLLTASFMFGSIFIYYYKAREPVKAFLREHEVNLPSMPAFPTVPHLPKLKAGKLRGLCKPLDKLGKMQWPLSSVSLPTSLPSFLHQAPVAPEPPPGPPPVPPPRTRRSRSRTVSPAGPRLATIVPRRPHPRPPAPGPPAPRKPSVLDISAPTEVTINGVTVAASSPMSQTAGGPTPSSRGVVCGPPPGASSSRFSSSSSVLSSSSSVLSTSSSSSSSSSGLLTARPVIVMADQPDSSMEPSSFLHSSSPTPSSTFPSCDVPPPLPSCPPPDSLSLGPTADSTEA